MFYYGGLETLAQLAILFGWSTAMLWGSVMAVRGKRMWATSLLFMGAICVMVGVLSVALVASVTFGTSYSTPQLVQIIGMLMIFLVPIGILLVTIGFVGLCARFGLAERRARELEVLVGQLQDRINSGR